MSDSNSCQALVLTCIDFRFNQQVITELRRRGIEAFDLKCDAGGVKYLIALDKPAVRDWIMENIEIARRLHHVERIVLINHYDCGAYGGNATWSSDEEQFEHHAAELTEAKRFLSDKLPGIQTLAFFAEMNQNTVSLREI